MAAENGEGEPAASGAQSVAAAGLWAGKGLREIAVDLFGAARVDAEWIPDGWMRAKVRRLVQRARSPSGSRQCGAGPGAP